MNGEDQLCCCHFASCSLHTRIILGFLSSEDLVSCSSLGLLVGFDEELLGVFPLPDPLFCGLLIKEDSNKLIPRGVARHIFENDVDGGVAHTPIVLGFLESWVQKESTQGRLNITNPCKQLLISTTLGAKIIIPFLSEKPRKIT